MKKENINEFTQHPLKGRVKKWLDDIHSNKRLNDISSIVTDLLEQYRLLQTNVMEFPLEGRAGKTYEERRVLINKLNSLGCLNVMEVFVYEPADVEFYEINDRWGKRKELIPYGSRPNPGLNICYLLGGLPAKDYEKKFEYEDSSVKISKRFELNLDVAMLTFVDEYIRNNTPIEANQNKINLKSNQGISHLTMGENYIGYQNGQKYQPNKGLTKKVVQTLSKTNKGRRKKGKILFNTTLTNILKLVVGEDELTEGKIKSSLYTISSGLKLNRIPVKISIKGNEVIIQED